MGLDMYLFKCKKGAKPTDENITEVGYWRKANEVHKFFEDRTEGGIEDCAMVEVTDMLEELRAACKEVLDDFSRASELLPTTDGFFFGSTEYDEWYREDLEHTIEIVERVLNEPDFNEYDYYYYPWW